MKPTTERVVKIFQDNRHIFIHRAEKKLHPPMFEYWEMEKVVDDVLYKVIMSRQGILGFNDETHVIKYFHASLNRTLRRSWLAKRTQLINAAPLSDEKMKAQYDIVLDIINSHRKS